MYSVTRRKLTNANSPSKPTRYEGESTPWRTKNKKKKKRKGGPKKEPSSDECQKDKLRGNHIIANANTMHMHGGRLASSVAINGEQIIVQKSRTFREH